MKPIYFLVLILILQACNKKDTTPAVSAPVKYAAPDFALIPTKNAKWYVHAMVDYYYDFYLPSPSFNLAFDKKYLSKVDFYIEALGKDTFIKSQAYHLYQITKSTTEPDSSRPYYIQSYRYYVREDTTTKKLYYENGEMAMDFSDIANQGQITPFYTWPVMDITKPDSLIVKGEYFKTWYMQNTYDKKLSYFYKAIGIGSSVGILRNNLLDGSIGQVVALDFVYKGDSVHFDFPLQ